MVTPKQMRPALRFDILCVLVIESTQHMQNLFPDLYDSVLTKIITQLRTPVIVDSPGKKDAAAKKGAQPTKATPCVRLGVVFFGDYYPYSTRTRSTKYFTSNYREFAKTIKEHRFCEGGRLRCAATEGLVGALEMFDDFDESDPEAGLTSVLQRHVILVSSTPPYAEPCRENDHVQYDGFGLDRVADRMRELKLSFSLVQERGKQIEQVETLLKAANISTKPALELPKSMSLSFDVRLVGIDLPIPPEHDTAASAATQPVPIAAQLQANIQLPQVSVHIQPVQAQVVPQTQAALPTKNKADASAMVVDAATGPKKPRTEADIPNAGAVAPEDPAKVARTKSRPKNPSATRPKAPRASNSPATAAMAAPTIPQTNVGSAAYLAATVVPGSNINTMNVAMANPSSVLQQQLHLGHPVLQQQSGGSLPMANSGVQVPQPAVQAATPAPNQSFLAIKQSLISQGITSDASHRVIFDLLSQYQNPSKTPEEKLVIKQRLESVMARIKLDAATQGAATQDGAQSGPQTTDTSTAAVARTTSQQSSVSTPQQQQQQQSQQQQQAPGMVSPPTQPVELPPATLQSLLVYALNAICTKQNVDLRHLLALLTPELLEASIRDACHDRPEIINNMAALKFTFGINYTAQELNLSEWPDQIRVKLMVEATIGFVENCVRSGIQMVRIGPSPNADQDTLKYFEDFSSTMREKPYYALANAGTVTPTFPFAGIILTFFRNHLVGLPFFHRQITEGVMKLLQHHTLPGNAAHQHQPGGNIIAGAQQMTPQPAVSGMPSTGTINATTAAALLARNASLASAAQQTAAQQIMSPQQSLAVRPNLSSPGVASSVPGYLQGFASVLQNRLTHEQMEAIWNLPAPQRDATIAGLLSQVMGARQTPQQLQAQLIMQQQQQQQHMAQLQQASHNQQLAQIFANQQLLQQQQHMLGNMSGLNPAMFSAAGQQGGATAFSSQPPNSQQLMPSQLIQQQQQQQQHRPS
ncbi:hypothetical protein IW152_002299 [Coemansia sp. BCRC 34962]|nr:hypothetical protein IW152_002299 [Coemansia sp. BCRC 34962]